MRTARCQCRSISKVCTQCFTKVEMLPLLWIIMDIILSILWMGLSHNLWSSYSISTALLLLLHQVQSPGQTYLQRVLQDLCVRLGRGHARRRLQGRAGISHVVPLEKKKKKENSSSGCQLQLASHLCHVLFKTPPPSPGPPRPCGSAANSEENFPKLVTRPGVGAAFTYCRKTIRSLITADRE